MPSVQQTESETAGQIPVGLQRRGCLASIGVLSRMNEEAVEKSASRVKKV